jgi:hypothetical protein
MKVQLRDVLLEDLSTLERTQAAVNSGIKKNMILQDQEVLVRHSAYVIDKLVQGALRGMGVTHEAPVLEGMIATAEAK